MEDETLNAFLRWEELSLSEEEYLAYEGRLKQLLDEQSMILEAKLEGKQEGILINKLETAKKLLEISMPIDQFAEVTGLSI